MFNHTESYNFLHKDWIVAKLLCAMQEPGIEPGTPSD